MDSLSMTVVARIRSDFPTKFGIPRQSGLVEALKASVIFEPEYRNPDALGLEGFSHLWLIWQFSEAVRTAGLPPCARPPGRKHADGRVRHPVPLPPIPSACPVSGWRGWSNTPPWGRCCWCRGADLMDGTLFWTSSRISPYADCRPEASCGFAGPDGGSCWRWNCQGACGRWYRGEARGIAGHTSP